MDIIQLMDEIQKIIFTLAGAGLAYLIMHIIRRCKRKVTPKKPSKKPITVPDVWRNNNDNY